MSGRVSPITQISITLSRQIHHQRVITAQGNDPPLHRRPLGNWIVNVEVEALELNSSHDLGLDGLMNRYNRATYCWIRSEVKERRG